MACAAFPIGLPAVLCLPLDSVELLYHSEDVRYPEPGFIRDPLPQTGYLYPKQIRGDRYMVRSCAAGGLWADDNALEGA